MGKKRKITRCGQFGHKPCDKCSQKIQTSNCDTNVPERDETTLGATERTETADILLSQQNTLQVI
jgi:hypothetical protein